VVLEQAGALRDAATIVLHHHEWYDGRGYPHGLAGGEIPIGARIVSIVDAYEAMVSGRPYRAAISHEDAIAELRRQAGVQFDPELVAVFAEVFAIGVPWASDADGNAAGEATSPVWPAAAAARTVTETDAAVPLIASGASNPGAAGGYPTSIRSDDRTTAQLHDGVHERRRRAG